MSDAAPPPGLDTRMGWAHIVGSSPADGPVLRSALSPHELVTCRQDADYQNIYQMFAKGGLKRRPAAPCFGHRFLPNGSIGPYSWQSYTEVSARIDAVAAALWKLELVPRAAEGLRFLGLYCKNSPEWMLVAEACYKTGVVVVPMYDTLGADVVSYIQGQTQARRLPKHSLAPAPPRYRARLRLLLHHLRRPCRHRLLREADGERRLLCGRAAQPDPAVPLCLGRGVRRRLGRAEGAVRLGRLQARALRRAGGGGRQGAAAAQPAAGAGGCRHRAAVLHERHHGRPQGGDAQPRQRHLGHGDAELPVRAGQVPHQRGRAGGAPLVPAPGAHLRDGRDELDALAGRRRRLLPGRHAQDPRRPAGAASAASAASPSITTSAPTSAAATADASAFTAPTVALHPSTPLRRRCAPQSSCRCRACTTASTTRSWAARPPKATSPPPSSPRASPPRRAAHRPHASAVCPPAPRLRHGR